MRRPGSGTPTTRIRPALRFAGWFVAYLAVTYVGRRTTLQAGGLALLWPGAGIAVLWVVSGRRIRAVDLAGIAAAGLLGSLAAGVAPLMALALVAARLAQVTATTAYLRRRVPQLWGFGGTRPLERVEDLGQVAVGAVLGAGLGTVLCGAGMLLTGAMAWMPLTLWWGGNALAVAVALPLALLAAPRVAGCRSLREVVAALRRSAYRSPAGPREGIALLAASVDLYWLVFFRADTATFGFLLLALLAWAGLRFCPLLAGIHGLGMCATGVLLTLAGQGPLAHATTLGERAALLQMFVALAGTQGLMLALSRHERDLALARLASARADEALRDELMELTLEELRRGVRTA